MINAAVEAGVLGRQPERGGRLELHAAAELGISDGFFTEVLNGLNEGDTLITGVIMPGAAPVLGAPGASAQNPFQGGGRGPGMGGMGGGGGGGGRGR